MTKVMGNQVKLSPKRRKGKRKNSAQNNQETRAKENQNESFKMKWAKFKKWTQIKDMANNERQPKCF